ncbi:MAG: PASTA domain-containing protein [Candidatus Margulisiibacteriota bacterium]|nr:PASTA domain-containing protein [Candidatus Margulisiibacteriota bacterium]
MFVSYTSSYLIFVIVVSVLLSIAFARMKLSSLRIILPIIAVVLLAPLFLGYLYLTYFTAIPEVVVPDLTGKTLEVALDELAEYKLKGKRAGSVFDMKFPEGRIVSQSPEIGKMVKVGRTISLITSSGKQKIFVPNLLGRPAIQAEAVLVAKGLRLGKIAREIVPEIGSGTILTQSPLPGEEVDISSFVHITVTVSPEPEVKEEN